MSERTSHSVLRAAAEDQSHSLVTIRVSQRTIELMRRLSICQQPDVSDDRSLGPTRSKEIGPPSKGSLGFSDEDWAMMRHELTASSTVASPYHPDEITPVVANTNPAAPLVASHLDRLPAEVLAMVLRFLSVPFLLSTAQRVNKRRFRSVLLETSYLVSLLRHGCGFFFEHGGGAEGYWTDPTAADSSSSSQSLLRCSSHHAAAPHQQSGTAAAGNHQPSSTDKEASGCVDVSKRGALFRHYLSSERHLPPSSSPTPLSSLIFSSSSSLSPFAGPVDSHLVLAAHVVYDRKVFIFGGKYYRTSFPYDKRLASGAVYDPTYVHSPTDEGSWNTHHHDHHAKSGSEGSTAGRYAKQRNGPASSSSSANGGSEDGPSSAGRWRPLPPMTVRRSACCGAVCPDNGLLYVFGGYDGATEHDLVEVLDPITRQWVEPVPATMRGEGRRMMRGKGLLEATATARRRRHQSEKMRVGGAGSGADADTCPIVGPRVSVKPLEVLLSTLPRASMVGGPSSSTMMMGPATVHGGLPTLSPPSTRLLPRASSSAAASSSSASAAVVSASSLFEEDDDFNKISRLSGEEGGRGAANDSCSSAPAWGTSYSYSNVPSPTKGERAAGGGEGLFPSSTGADPAAVASAVAAPSPYSVDVPLSMSISEAFAVPTTAATAESSAAVTSTRLSARTPITVTNTATNTSAVIVTSATFMAGRGGLGSLQRNNGGRRTHQNIGAPRSIDVVRQLPNQPLVATPSPARMATRRSAAASQWGDDEDDAESVGTPQQGAAAVGEWMSPLFQDDAFHAALVPTKTTTTRPLFDGDKSDADDDDDDDEPRGGSTASPLSYAQLYADGGTYEEYSLIHADQSNAEGCDDDCEVQQRVSGRPAPKGAGLAITPEAAGQPLQLPPLRSPYAFCEGAVASHAHYIYLTGGTMQRSQNDEFRVATVSRLNTRTQRWDRLPDMPCPSGSGGGASGGGGGRHLHYSCVLHVPINEGAGNGKGARNGKPAAHTCGLLSSCSAGVAPPHPHHRRVVSVTPCPACAAERRLLATSVMHAGRNGARSDGAPMPPSGRCGASMPQQQQQQQQQQGERSCRYTARTENTSENAADDDKGRCDVRRTMAVLLVVGGRSVGASPIGLLPLEDHEGNALMMADGEEADGESCGGAALGASGEATEDTPRPLKCAVPRWVSLPAANTTSATPAGSVSSSSFGAGDVVGLSLHPDGNKLFVVSRSQGILLCWLEVEAVETATEEEVGGGERSATQHSNAASSTAAAVNGSNHRQPVFLPGTFARDYHNDDERAVTPTIVVGTLRTECIGLPRTAMAVVPSTISAPAAAVASAPVIVPAVVATHGAASNTSVETAHSAVAAVASMSAGFGHAHAHSTLIRSGGGGIPSSSSSSPPHTALAVGGARSIPSPAISPRPTAVAASTTNSASTAAAALAGLISNSLHINHHHHYTQPPSTPAAIAPPPPPAPTTVAVPHLSALSSTSLAAVGLGGLSHHHASPSPSPSTGGALPANVVDSGGVRVSGRRVVTYRYVWRQMVVDSRSPSSPIPFAFLC